MVNSLSRLNYGMVDRHLELDRSVLANAHVEPNNLDDRFYSYHNNNQLRRDRDRNDKDSGGLF